MDRRQNAQVYFLRDRASGKAYEYLGAHRTPRDGFVFRVFAPNASAVSLVGDFSDWERGIPMRRISDSGIWETVLDEHSAEAGDKYKYLITAKGGERLWRSDPYSFECERGGGGASLIASNEDYAWRDASYIAYRERRGRADAHIYELDLALWQGGAAGRLGYRAIAAELAPYVKQLGCTHIALSGACEYISDGHGREAYSYFAPNSRLGSPQDMAAFVDSMHEAGVGVIMRLDISELPKRALGCYDGGAVYEYKDGLSVFDASKIEVQSLVVSCAGFWLQRYHMDGLLFGAAGEASTRTARASYARAVLIGKISEYVKKEFPYALLLTDAERKEAEAYALESVSRAVHTPCLCECRTRLAQIISAQGHSLIPMGAELGESAKGENDAPNWSLLEDERHARLQLCAAELGQLWLSSSALRDGQTSVLCTEPLCYIRRSNDEAILVLCNASDKKIENFYLSAPEGDAYREIFNSDSTRYGGQTSCESEGVGEYKNSITADIPPMATILFKLCRDDTKNATTKNT